ncbi:nSTAND3 domain-containing NTPase [Achromobacter kerstersii]
MPRYDYKSLSPQDFEELTRDLLQAEWNVPLEAFKTGRDHGIDLRYAPIYGGTTIVQCKHYASSSVSNLLSHLINSELPKVQALRPDRYVIVTSLPLSPLDKDKIALSLAPFISTTGDVLGADDLNGLLSRHPTIEQANFKLWLTSTSVLNRVLHNAEVRHAEFEVERIRSKLPLFVQNSSFSRAQQLLSEQRIVIISGVPGIGKTTLAEMLLYAHLDSGYQPVVLQTDVSEGKKLFRQQDKQIFYYDDFLGQTFLGDQRTYVGRNHDAAMVSFMEMVRSTPHSRFILTTREHILRQAFQISERFMHSTMMTHRCVLELNDYSFGQRARILYNHLYFSDLPQDYKDAVLQDDFFLDIIKHEHFNPRLIEWLVSLTRLQSPPPERYRQSVVELLQCPERIWSHAFEHQISDAGRDLLLSLYTLGEWTGITTLEPIFEAVHAGISSRYNRPRSPRDFYSALQELDGAFLKYWSGMATFVNPSVREFTAGIILRTPHVAADLLDNTVRFSQFSNIWELARKQTGQPLLAAFYADIAALRLRAERVLYGPSLHWETTPKGSVGSYIDSREEGRLGTLLEIAEASESLEFMELCSTYADWLIDHWKRKGTDFQAALRSLEKIYEGDWLFQHGARPIYRRLLNALLGHLGRANVDDWLDLLSFPGLASDWLESDEVKLKSAFQHYQTFGIGEDLGNCDTTEELNSLRDGLQALNERHGIDFSKQIRKIENAIADSEDHHSDTDDDGQSYSSAPSTARAETVTEDEVRDMFKTLKD